MINIKAFISYSHKDDDARQELDKWLVTLRDKGIVHTWFDGNAIPGDYLMSKITKKMEEANVIILLLSQNYLSSDACKEEMSYALEAPHKKVIPVILKTCAWQETRCKDLLALPKDGRPVNNWRNKEDAWHNVYEGIKKAIVDLQHNFEIKDDFLGELQQIEFVTQSKKGTTLNEIFVFPNLSATKDAFKSEVIGYDFFLEKKRKNVLVRGREACGKTALLKWLYMHLGDTYSPIFIDGNFIHKTLNFDDHFKKEFFKQMSGDFDAWMSQDNKVVIIDNYNHSISYNLLEYMENNFHTTIIAMDDEEYMLYFKDEASFADFTILTIGQFDFVQQEELIRKWFQISQQNTEVDDLAVDKLEARVNNVITTQRIVPRYPFYILSILQSLESFMPSGIRITAYGHCYQALVTAQLVKKNIKVEDLDTCFNYLRSLSFDIYTQTNRGGIYSKNAYYEFREAYKLKFIISEALINKIENGDYPILEIQDEHVRFKHYYIYYFFLGMQIAIIEDEYIINNLCDKIHLRQNAFILIFTIHHTQNKKLLDTIRLHCVYSFEGTEPAKLCATETKFMNTLIAELPQSIISKKSVSKNRIEQRKNKKIQTEESERNDVESDEAGDVSIIEINKGIKIIEVLGQILKNRAGSFERKDVEEILEDTINLGLRILNLFLNEYRKPEFAEWLSTSLEEAEKELIETRNREFSDDQRRAFIEKSIQFFGYVVTIGMLNRIYEAIATEKLTGTMQLLADKNPTPAYELLNYLVSSSQDGLDTRLVKSLQSEYSKTKNFWAEKTLSYYVQNYLNTHHVNYKERQKIFEAFNIKYLPNKG